MADTDNLPFIMTYDEVETSPADSVHPETSEAQEPQGDDAGEGEPVVAEDKDFLKGQKLDNGLIRYTVNFRVKSEKADDKDKDALAKDEAVALDAREVKTGWEDCKAKEPARCPYHGIAKMTDDFQKILDTLGLGALKSVGFSITKNDTYEGDISYKLVLDCPDETIATKKAREAIAKFGHIGYVRYDDDDEKSDAIVEKSDTGWEMSFETDFLDKDCEDPSKEACSPKVEEVAKEEALEGDGDGRSDVDEGDDADTPEVKEEEPTTPEPEKPKDEVPPEPPKDDVEKALELCKDYGHIPGMDEVERRILEAKAECDQATVDEEFLKNAISAAPSDRVKDMLSEQLSLCVSARAEKDNALKMACMDAKVRLANRLSFMNTENRGKFKDIANDTPKTDDQKDLSQLAKDCGLTSLTKAKGYKEYKAAAKAYQNAADKLVSSFDLVSDALRAEDFSKAAKEIESANAQLSELRKLADQFKAVRGNLKASLETEKKATIAKRIESLMKSAPDKCSEAPLPTETIAEYIERQKALGRDIPMTLLKHQERIDFYEDQVRNKARARGITDEVFDRATENFKQSVRYAFANSAVGAKIPILYGKKGGRQLKLLSCIKNGFKNQFELAPSKSSEGTSAGLTSLPTRARFAKDKFGMPLDRPGEAGNDELRKQREKYGSFVPSLEPSKSDHKCGTEWYGGAYIRFKKDEIAASFTFGDSLGGEDEPFTPSFISDASFTSLWGCGYGADVEAFVNRYKDGPKLYGSMYKLMKETTSATYGEFVFHGQLPPSKIESVNLDGDVFWGKTADQTARGQLLTTEERRQYLEAFRDSKIKLFIDGVEINVEEELEKL